jgi:hypothetical protein
LKKSTPSSGTQPNGDVLRWFIDFEILLIALLGGIIVHAIARLTQYFSSELAGNELATGNETATQKLIPDPLIGF